jgi:hypothetical protein
MLAKFGQPILYDRPPRTPKNVTDKKNFQDQVPGSTEKRRSRGPNFDGITQKT